MATSLLLLLQLQLRLLRLENYNELAKMAWTNTYSSVLEQYSKMREDR